jgi:hypothetical protein
MGYGPPGRTRAGSRRLPGFADTARSPLVAAIGIRYKGVRSKSTRTIFFAAKEADRQVPAPPRRALTWIKEKSARA